MPVFKPLFCRCFHFLTACHDSNQTTHFTLWTHSAGPVKLNDQYVKLQNRFCNYNILSFHLFIKKCPLLWTHCKKQQSKKLDISILDGKQQLFCQFNCGIFYLITWVGVGGSLLIGKVIKLIKVTVQTLCFTLHFPKACTNSDYL